MNNSLNIEEEWAFIYHETKSKAPKSPLSKPLVQTRELLLRLQVLLTQYEQEKNIKKKYNLFTEYNFFKNLYCYSINGGLN